MKERLQETTDEALDDRLKLAGRKAKFRVCDQNANALFH